MSSAPTQVTKKSSNKSPSEKAGSTHHGAKFGFNPQAKEFIPGTRSPNLGGQNLQRPEASGRGHKGKQQQNGHRGHSEGGLSKALRSTKDVPVDSPQRGSEDIALPQRPSETSLLGKSPNHGHVSANHLLNFQRYQPQQRRDRDQQRSGRSGRRSGGSREPYNANKFLQANFRFLVSDAADLQPHSRDADLMLDWGDVLEVEILVPAPLKCPITLETPPLCPQITPCGHVFSFPGIMAHLITNGGDALRKASPCPLCNAPVAARELRLVRTHIHPAPRIGEEVEFRLLKRLRSEIIPRPVTSHGSDDHALPSTSEKQGRIATPAHDTKPWLCHTTRGRGNEESSSVDLDVLGYNHFAKFTQVKAAPALWEQAAKDLASYAAEVTEAGGLDAAQEAPFIFGAMDALAARAASWAERRQRMLQDRRVTSSEKLAPEDAACQAAQAVKRITNATILTATKDKKAKAHEDDRMSQFPTLNSQPSQGPSTAANLGTSPSGTAKQAKMHFEAAFSDEDSPRQDRHVQSSLPSLPASDAVGADTEDQQASNLQRETHVPDGVEGGPSKESKQSSKTSGPQTSSNEYYFYQASGGQWIFLHPLLMRILLNHYGSYESLPPVLGGQLLELESQKQTELLRKRQKFLGHLPLGGFYHLAEIDLTSMLPQASLAPFTQEIAVRDGRREARLAEERRVAEEDSQRLLEMEASGKGPSAAELKAMPLLGGNLDTGRTESEDLQEAFALSLLGEDNFSSSPPPAPPQDGISFAHMARMGFAATGPTLPANSPGTTSNAWGPKPGRLSESPLDHSYPPKSNSSPRNWSQALKAAEKDERPIADGGGTSSRSKKGSKKVVLLGMPNRKY